MRITLARIFVQRSEPRSVRRPQLVARNETAWLLGSLRETAGRPAAEVAHHLLGAVETFVGEGRWHDDVSLVVMRRAG